MKKIFTLVFTMLFAVGFSQEKEENKINSVGLQVTGSQITTFGVYYEKLTKDKKDYYMSSAIELNYASTKAKISGLEFTGNGIEIRSSFKNYFSKNKATGFFSKNSLTYGNISFDDNDNIGSIQVNYKGTYSYFSFFAPEIGYDFMIGKIRAGLVAGTQWQIEVKGKDNVDNKDFDNWLYRVGLRMSYDF